MGGLLTLRTDSDATDADWTEAGTWDNDTTGHGGWDTVGDFMTDLGADMDTEPDTTDTLAA